MIPRPVSLLMRQSRHVWELKHTFALNYVVEICLMGQLTLHKSPNNFLIVMWKNESLEGFQIPFNFTNIIDIELSCQSRLAVGTITILFPRIHPIV